MARSVPLGGGEQVKGLKQLAAQIKALDSVVYSAKCYGVVGKALGVVREKAVSNARAANWPHETIENFFVDARPKSGKRAKKVSALFGVPKKDRPGYEKWRGKPQGRVIGMNLATLYEFGGMHRPDSPKAQAEWLAARPSFRPALQSERQKMLGVLDEGLKQVLDEAVKEEIRKKAGVE